MTAVLFDDEPYVDPDDQKMPERPIHRHSVDLIAIAAEQLLGPGVRLFKNMNWYPDDRGDAVAPDVMVISAEAIEKWPRSYRQDETGGPPPLVLVEVPSETDTYVSFRAKVRRYQRLGTTTYVVTTEEGDHDVLRLGFDDPQFVSWVGEPIPELGGLRLHFDEERLVVTLPDEVQFRSVRELIADTWRAVTEDARREAEDARRRMGAMAAQLRALGVEPE